MKTILLKFSGPLQSWGTSSHFETRHTDFYPSKSAVVGLIAACLGYRRDDDANIQKLNELDFAIRVDQQGNLLRDYHTVKKYKKNGEIERTYVTNRYYLEDAVFIVAVSHKEDEFVDTIVGGLKNPYFQPFLGRRSCPLPADFILRVTTEGVIDSLKKLEWQAAGWYMKSQSHHKVSLEIYADSYLTEQKSYQLRQDRVQSFSQKERKFGFRYESRILMEVSNSNSYGYETTHDIFSNIGD
ncbi:type I-E CRISPR-associated protein Cas5/CasD [Streptococcus mutans]|nr:type I-E CRISPR-associated protein Cas5/CasD [Streptococcus mutans]MCB5086423.1 type I-E CRISPR-associated protein Cas5/CasD [Streptococcus mutans]